jgi:hypothetical protein
VSVDLLSNPATGQTIRDILRVTFEPQPGTPKVQGDEFVLDRAGIALRTRSGEQHWISKVRLAGAAVLMYLPGRGAYFLSLARPASGGFEPSGTAVRNRISFIENDELIEIESQSNALRHGGFARVWVGHDPAYKPQGDPTRLFLTSADAIDYLLPKM